MKRGSTGDQIMSLITYQVILRKNNDKNLAKILMAAGFAYLRSCRIAQTALKKDQIIEITHFERAELIQSRIMEQEKNIKVDLIRQGKSSWRMES